MSSVNNYYEKFGHGNIIGSCLAQPGTPNVCEDN